MTEPDPAFRAGVAFVDGGYVPIADARIPMLDLGFLRSDACQDTISIWKGRFFRLEDHLARFERSFTRLRMTCPYDRDRLRAIATECVRKTGLRDAYLQLIMTRGRMPIGSRDIRLAQNRFQAFCIPYVWIANADVRARGLDLHVSAIRRVPEQSVDPTVKHYHWLDFEMGLLEAYDRGADSVLLTDLEGNVAEGPGFNVFAVRDGELLTPQSGVLDGMTRTTVFDLAGELNMRARLAPLSPAALRSAQEVFICSTAGGIMPVRKVDDATIGDGAPGPTTRRLEQLYWRKREQGWLGTPIAYD
ncbi:MAG: aminotransferase class IV [Alphaproteobacteria bacterium]|nr:aminotransferase class IV [Alphaproteobacteria bacterium]